MASASAHSSPAQVEITSSAEEDQHVRKMDTMERLVFNMAGVAVNVAMPFVVESQDPLTEDLITHAAILLTRRHPLLRSRIRRETNANTGKEELFFREMREKDLVDIRLVDEFGWADVTVTDGKTVYDLDKGPLWRLWLLKTTEIPPEEREFRHPCRTNLVLGIHHGIMDANSGMRLIDGLLTFLEMVQNKSDGLAEVASLPLIPGMYDLMPKQSINMPWYKFYKLIGLGFKAMRQPNGNPYIKNHKEDIESREDFEREGTIYPVILQPSFTSKIISQSKKNGITVNSTLTTACGIAAAKFIFGEHLQPGKAYSFSSLFAVDMRRFLPDNPGTEHVSGFFGNVAYEFKVSAVTSADEFWKMAKSCHNDLQKCINHGSLESTKILNFMLRLGVDPLKMVMKAMANAPYRLMMQAFYMSNMGRCDFVAREGGRPFELTGVYMRVASPNISPLIINNIFTFHGRMFWSLVYCPHIMSEERAKEFIDFVKDILKMACGEVD